MGIEPLNPGVRGKGAGCKPALAMTTANQIFRNGGLAFRIPPSVCVMTLVAAKKSRIGDGLQPLLSCERISYH